MRDGERIVAVDPLAGPGEEPAKAVWVRSEELWKSLAEFEDMFVAASLWKPLSKPDIASVTREIARGG